MPIFVFKYGLLPPVAEGERVAEQIRLAHVYQNALIEIEHKSREAREAVLARVPAIAAINDQVGALEKELELARVSLSAERSDARSKSAGDTTRAKNIVAALKPLWAQRKILRNEAFASPAVKAELEVVDEARKAAIRGARGACGVFWGTYLPIEAAVEQSRKSPTPLRFRRWTGEGSVSMQLMKGLPVAKALDASDRRFQICVVPVPVPGRGGKPLPRVRLRVGSTEDRGPLFAEWPLIFHRALPEGSVLKWAKVVRRRTGAHNSWSLHLTLDVPAPAAVPDVDNSAAAVNLRWSKAGDVQTTVADWADGTSTGDLKVEPEIDSMLAKADDLRSIRDKNFEKARTILKEHVQGLALPAEHKERLEFLHAWKACGKLAAVVLWWRGNRFDGDSEAFIAAESWRRQDKHLWDWEANARRKALARRRDGYRVFAARIAASHSVLVIEKLNISRLAKKPEPEAERELNAQASSQRFSAAPSELRGALVNAFRRDGKRIVEVPAGLTSNEMLALFRSSGGAEIAAPAVRSKRFTNLHKNKKAAPAPT